MAAPGLYRPTGSHAAPRRLLAWRHVIPRRTSTKGPRRTLHPKGYFNQSHSLRLDRHADGLPVVDTAEAQRRFPEVEGATCDPLGEHADSDRRRRARPRRRRRRLRFTTRRSARRRDVRPPRRPHRTRGSNWAGARVLGCAIGRRGPGPRFGADGGAAAGAVVAARHGAPGRGEAARRGIGHRAGRRLALDGRSAGGSV